MRLAWFGCALVSLVLCMSGCGDDDSDDGTDGSGASSSGGSGSGASGTGASGTGASGTGGSGDDPPPAGECRDEEDCEFDGCLAPSDLTCGGACQEPTAQCADDTECKGLGAEGICKALPCACMADAAECALGCGSNADCGDGTTCGDDFRCEPAACQGEGDCPDDFSCTSGTCGRTQCALDAECDGHCVKGSCWTDFGYCGAAPGG